MYNLCKFSPSVSLVFFFFLPSKQDTLVQTAFKTEGFLVPPVSTCPVVFASVHAKPTQGERGPHPCPPGWERSTGLGPQTSRESRFCPLPPPLLTRLRSSLASDLRIPPHPTPQKALGSPF